MADDPTLAEFRDTNIALMKEVDDLKTKYKDIDTDAVTADRVKLTEFEAAKAQLDAARLELTTAKAALAAAQIQSLAAIELPQKSCAIPAHSNWARTATPSGVVTCGSSTTRSEGTHGHEPISSDSRHASQ